MEGEDESSTIITIVFAYAKEVYYLYDNSGWKYGVVVDR